MQENKFFKKDASFHIIRHFHNIHHTFSELLLSMYNFYFLLFKFLPFPYPQSTAHIDITQKYFRVSPFFLRHPFCSISIAEKYCWSQMPPYTRSIIWIGCIKRSLQNTENIRLYSPSHNFIYGIDSEKRALYVEVCAILCVWTAMKWYWMILKLEYLEKYSYRCLLILY